VKNQNGEVVQEGTNELMMLRRPVSRVLAK
jgi:hypothetical protein